MSKMVLEKYIEIVKKIYDNSKIVVLSSFSDYRGFKEEILVKCEDCGVEYYSKLNSLVQGCGCKYCNKGGRKKNSQDQFKNYCDECYKNGIKILSSYVYYQNNKSLMECQCLVCGSVFLKRYCDIRNIKMCESCSLKKKKEDYKLTEEEFKQHIKELKKINISVITKYNDFKKIKDKINVRCDKCGYEYDVYYHNIIRSKECKSCNLKKFVSEPEKEIKEYVETIYDKEIITSDRKILKGRELDLYLPDISLAIEFNGNYWHSEQYKSKKYHYNKFDRCNKQNIRLYQIWEDEWNNNRDFVKNRIKSLINDEIKLNYNEKYIEINLDLGYNINEFYEKGYIVKEIKENKINVCGKNVYRTGIMILNRV